LFFYVLGKTTASELSRIQYQVESEVKYPDKGLLLKINASKFTRGLEPLYGDACSAKSVEVLTLVLTRFENVFFLFLENQTPRSRGGEIGLVRCLDAWGWPARAANNNFIEIPRSAGVV
jgi:hypothetical protein